ncbi:MAG: AfsR/SARP family transcriptional regulator [Pseudonocardiaceae bacterium]
MEPLDESGQLLLLKSLAADGDAPAALRCYAAYRRSLAAELGVEPGPELREAYLAVLREQRTAPPAAPDRARTRTDVRGAPVE